MNNYSIVGIHTGIGKTICSAILCQAFGFDYWKPVQAGDLNNTDSMIVKAVVSNKLTTIHPECYKMSHAVSPHRAAELDKVNISKHDFTLPATSNPMIVETAGGVMSPLSKELLNIDLIEWLNIPAILVSNNYLGSINHTLLTIEAMKKRNIPIKGLVFVGEPNRSSESFIEEYSGLSALFHIPHFTEINKNQISSFAKNIQSCFNES
jgi:dethiobiotin synthetase